MFFAHFNAGVRALDIRDPYHPKEIASYIPAVTANSDQRCAKLEDGQQHCAKVIQTNNVEVDDRGYIYIVDRANNGMHILELTGPARDGGDFPEIAQGCRTRLATCRRCRRRRLPIRRSRTFAGEQDHRAVALGPPLRSNSFARWPAFTAQTSA